MLPHDTLYSSSILEPAVKSGSWNRYIYHASSSFWAPSSTNPIIGKAGSITDFSAGSTQVTLLTGEEATGSYVITCGG